MPVEVIPGQSPLIVALPHTGTNIPRVIYRRLNAVGRSLADADAYLDRLLSDDITEDVTTLRATFHHYVSDPDHIDRPSRDRPENGMIGVVPLLGRDGARIWDQPPSVSEAASWRSMFFAPFQAALSAQVARVRARHGQAVLITLNAPHGSPCDGLSAFTFATYLAQPDTIRISTDVVRLLEQKGGYLTELRGRAHTGGITRHYSNPVRLVHAMQIGVRQGSYLGHHPEPGQFDEARAAPLRARIAQVFDYLKQPAL